MLTLNILIEHRYEHIERRVVAFKVNKGEATKEMIDSIEDTVILGGVETGTIKL